MVDVGDEMIDVYLKCAARRESGADKDTGLVRQIIERLRAAGYEGPDFSHSDRPCMGAA